MISDKTLWRAMQLLTHVQSVDMGSRNKFTYSPTLPTKQFPNDLFHSTTSVTLMGRMQYGLAKSILSAVNSATLWYLCLDMVRELRYRYLPGLRDEERALGATLGLLTTLTGCCKALRTLILRRAGRIGYGKGWYPAVEEASYIEWASFIRSVQGTVENFTFEHAGKYMGEKEPTLNDRGPYRFRSADKRFRRIILPTIISVNWPCLTVMEIKGVKIQGRSVGIAALIMELRAVLGGNTKIVVEEKICYT